MTRRPPIQHVAASRAGLAPLEFVLSLPLLLMIMAMIIIVGTAGSWKVRTLANSRQAAARSIWPRDGANDPKPASWWPDSATMSAGGAEPEPFDYDPFSQHAVVRGPVVGTRGGSGLNVNTDLLDISRGMLAGHASIDRDLPLWRQLPWRNRYRRSTHVFSGDQWQFGLMNLEDNARRRIPVLYPEYNLSRYGDFARVMRAHDAILDYYQDDTGRKVLVLDRDDELHRDFYHPIPWETWCTTELQAAVDLQKARIDAVPCEMAHAFCEYYRAQIGGGNTDPRLQQYVQQLDQFMQSQCGGARCQ